MLYGWTLLFANFIVILRFYLVTTLILVIYPAPENHLLLFKPFMKFHSPLLDVSFPVSFAAKDNHVLHEIYIIHGGIVLAFLSKEDMMYENVMLGAMEAMKERAKNYSHTEPNPKSRTSPDFLNKNRHYYSLI